MAEKKNIPVPDKSVPVGTEVLGADRNVLLGQARTKSEPVAREDVLAMPDNSVENLAKTKEIVDARGFLRAKGVADHLYSDDVVVEKYREYQALPFDKKAGPIDMSPKVCNHVNAPAGEIPAVVKSAEYSTAEGDLKPHYKEKEEADTPTPVDPNLPKA